MGKPTRPKPKPKPRPTKLAELHAADVARSIGRAVANARRYRGSFSDVVQIIERTES